MATVGSPRPVPPDVSRSRIGSLIQPMSAAPFTLAPERAAELKKLVDEEDVKIFIDQRRQDFTVEVSSMLKMIILGLPTLERIWAYGYSYLVLVRQFQKHGMGVEIDLQAHPETQRARQILLWAHQADISGRFTDWPTELPHPEKNETEDANLRPANELFLSMSAWMILHELAHIVCKHQFDSSVPAEKSIAMEIEADNWASGWLMEKWQEYKVDLAVFQNRTLGVTIAIAIQAGFELYHDKRVSITHPSTVDRLLNFLDRYVPERDVKKAEPREIAWLAAVIVIQVHLINSGKHLDPKREYQGFREFLMASREIIASTQK